VTPPCKRLRAEACAALEDMVVSQVLKPGSTMTEGELALSTGIGRTPTRAALQRLAREGIVSVRPRSAIVIVEMTHARQLQLLEARAALQEKTVRLAAERADVEQSARMLQLLQAVQDAAAIGDGELYLRIARDIRHLLCGAVRNEFLERLMSSLYTLSRQFSFTRLREVDISLAASTHADILCAIAADDRLPAGVHPKQSEQSRSEASVRIRCQGPQPKEQVVGPPTTAFVTTIDLTREIESALGVLLGIGDGDWEYSRVRQTNAELTGARRQGTAGRARTMTMFGLERPDVAWRSVSG